MSGLRSFPRCLKRYCTVCGQAANDELCRACFDDLPWNKPACCHCALPLPSNSVRCCSRCQAKRPLFQSAFSALRYEFPVANLLRQLKYGSRLEVAPILAALFCRAIRASEIELPKLLIPVPLHDKRLRRRGFNQAHELAKAVGGRLDIRIKTGMDKLRDTRPQSELNAQSRRRNLRGAFAVNHQDLPAVVAVFDDVITTGSTMTEITRALHKNGVRQVQAWSIARVVFS